MKCSFFAIDPIAQRRFATPVEPLSVQPPFLRFSVVIPFSPSPLFPFPPSPLFPFPLSLGFLYHAPMKTRLLSFIAFACVVAVGLVQAVSRSEERRVGVR